VLHPFISCQASPPRRIHVLLASTAFHAVLLGLAITPVTSARFSSVPHAVEAVQYMTLSLGGAVRTEPAGTPHRTVHGTLRAPRIGPIDLAVALTLVSTEPSTPTPSFPSMADSLWGDPLSNSPVGRPDLSSPSPGQGPGVGSDSGAYIAATVEKEAVSTGDNAKPVYPSDLLNRLVEARFSVFFVVDTTGRVDSTTIEVSPSVHVQFAKAVRDVLVHWHFYPAEVRGRRVRQLMEQPFEFRIVASRFAGVAAR
jgi:TonB family protein